MTAQPRLLIQGETMQEEQDPWAVDPSLTTRPTETITITRKQKRLYLGAMAVLGVGFLSSCVAALSNSGSPEAAAAGPAPVTHTVTYSLPPQTETMTVATTQTQTVRVTVRPSRTATPEQQFADLSEAQDASTSRSRATADDSEDSDADSGRVTTYANCDAARAAGAAPLYRGEPGYAARLDRDNDGIACER